MTIYRLLRSCVPEREESTERAAQRPRREVPPRAERCRSRPSRRSCRGRSSTHKPLCRGPDNIDSDVSRSPQVSVVTTRTALTSRCPTEVPVCEMSRRKQARPIRVYESEDGVGLEPPQIVNGKECCVVTSDKCLSDKITYPMLL